MRPRVYTAAQIERSLEKFPHGDGLDHDRLIETALALEIAKAEIKRLRVTAKFLREAARNFMASSPEGRRRSREA